MFSQIVVVCPILCLLYASTSAIDNPPQRTCNFFVGSFSNITSTFVVSDHFEYGRLASFIMIVPFLSFSRCCMGSCFKSCLFWSWIYRQNMKLMRFKQRYKQIYYSFMFIWIRLTEKDTIVSCLQLLLPNQVIRHKKSICLIWIFIDPCLAALNVVGIYGHRSCNIDIKRSNAGRKCNGGDQQSQQLSFSRLLTKGHS